MIALPLAAAVVAAAPAATPQAAIEQALADSAAGWNAGDDDRFMRVYADDAVYATGDTVARGKPAIAAVYAKALAADAATRGTLSLRPVAWRPLSAVHVLLVARYTLTRPGGAAPMSGITSLVFERRKAGWQIIADHS